MNIQADIAMTVNRVQRILLRAKDSSTLFEQLYPVLADNTHFSSVRIKTADGAVLPAADRAPAEDFCGDNTISFPVTWNNRIFGQLCISTRADRLDDDSCQLLRETAEHIALTICRLEQEKRLQLLKKEYPLSRRELKERIKELKCLYAVSRLMEKRGISRDEIFKGALQYIPPALEYPEIACARIKLDDREFTTDNWQETSWKQSRVISANDSVIGVLEVCYLKEPSVRGPSPFLEEEGALLGTIAERLGKAAEALKMEETLQEQETSFRNLVENSLVGITILQNSEIVYLNSEQKRISAELPVALDSGQREMIHPDDLEKVAESYGRITSGEIKLVDLNFRFFHAPDRSRSQETKWVYCRASTAEYRGSQAVLIYMLDVTRSRHLENLLRVKDKMVSLGHVTAGIAHEIRNPLSGINIYLNALDKIWREKSRVETIPDIIRQMQSASGKIESVIRRVMDFSRPTEPRLTRIDINEPVKEAIDLSSVTLRKIDIELKRSLSQDLPACRADPILLEQVILNLITNAAEAMKNNSGPKIIEIRSELIDNSFRVSVGDSGPGVPAGMKDKIFDPFYSTKSSNTGIGLSLGHRIITDHGGTLEVSESRYGGALFTIEIPVKRKNNA